MKYMPINEKEQFVTSLRIDPELWKKAKIEAVKCDITLGDLIDEAIRDWIQKKEDCKK